MTRAHPRVAWLIGACAGILLAHTPAGASPRVEALPSALGPRQLVWHDAPASPWAAVILFPGGDGALGMREDGAMGGLTGNFLVRTRANWMGQGLAVLIPDAPEGRTHLRDLRATEAYASDIAAQVRFARERYRVPVWLIGTSNGTVAAANGAARAAPGTVAGVVLTSSVTRLGRQAQQSETALSVPLAQARMPALVVAHRDDGCFATPPSGAETLRAALSGSPRAEVLYFSGGLPAQSAPCEARAAHGFLGIENEVVSAIVGWMRR